MSLSAQDPVVSTYRLQMRGDGFTFDDAEKLVDYLDDLGVSHLYLSPILTAADGSTHGYDVVDPTEVSPALGGAEGLARLSAAAKARGLGLIVDIVPNHLGVDDPTQNRWWWDLLTHGRDSRYANYFDVDWDLDPTGRIVLPVLGSDDDANRLVVDGEVLRLDDRTWPIAPGTAEGSGPNVHDRQHYRLVGWRSEWASETTGVVSVCGYRRFFSITSLAGLRQEDEAVFDATHVEVKRWFDEGLVDGVRIDHPDGLSDPAGYLARLRRLTGPQAWIVVEKILAVEEPLDTTLPVAGTTGYDVLREIGGLFVDPAGEQALTALFDSAGGEYGAQVARALKADAVTQTLASELARLRRRIVAVTGADHPDLSDAVAALLSHVGVYRCDYPSLASVLAVALARTRIARPALAAPLSIIAAAVGADRESGARLQQLCGAGTAKSMEDCLFYRDARLVSLNEVGGEPDWFGVDAAEFHDRAATRSRMWPTAMTTLTTHDTKRGEDVRARIGVLSQVPSLWAELVGKWTVLAAPPDAATALFLWQNVFGVWPVGGEVSVELRERLHAYTEKAIREAAVHTNWNDPNDHFESAVHDWLDEVLDGPVAAQLTSLVDRLDVHGRSDALGQKLIALTAPGVPDVYQGTELWEDSLVDPDNRRPVDYAARRVELTTGAHPKLKVTREALRLRRDRLDTFRTGAHRPVFARGRADQHVVAFLRGDDVLVAVSRWTVRLADDGWGDTFVDLPEGRWTDRLSGRTHAGRTEITDLFAELPVALLERTDA